MLQHTVEMEEGPITLFEDFKQQYDDEISSNLVSSTESLKVLLQLLTAPGLEDWAEDFMDQYQDEMKEDLDADEEKAEALHTIMLQLLVGSIWGKLDEDDEEWVEDKRDELEEFLAVVEEIREILPED